MFTHATTATFYKTIMNKFNHSRKLVLCRVLGQKPKLLGYDNQISGDKFVQTIHYNVFVDFRNIRERKDRSEDRS